MTACSGAERGICEIPITRGLVTLVDLSDLEEYSRWRWQAVKGKNGVFYARRTDTYRGSVYLHREIFKKYFGPLPENSQIDHIDLNGLNNSLSNLRLSDHGRNQHNSLFKRKDSNSQFRGVYNKNGLWIAHIYFDRTHYLIGKYSSEVEAAEAYNAKASELYDDHARLNRV